MSEPQRQRRSKSFWALLLALILGASTVVGCGTIPAQESPKGATEDPIRIDYEDDKQRALEREDLALGGIIEDFDPNKSLSYYKDNDLVAYSSPLIDIDVVSQVNDESVGLAPYLVVTITDIEPVPETVDFVGPGGITFGETDIFVATLSPERDKIFGAPHRCAVQAGTPQPCSNQENFDNFTLQPGEREVFKLLISMTPDYYYHYRVGVPYSHKGDQSVKWIDREFIAGRSTKAKSYYSGALDRPPQEPGPQPQIEEDRIEREEEAIQEYQSSFTLPQSGPDG